MLKLYKNRMQQYDTVQISKCIVIIDLSNASIFFAKNARNAKMQGMQKMQKMQGNFLYYFLMFTEHFPIYFAPVV